MVVYKKLNFQFNGQRVCLPQARDAGAEQRGDPGHLQQDIQARRLIQVRIIFQTIGLNLLKCLLPTL